MQPVVAVAGTRPFALTRFDRALQWLVGRALDEIEQRRGAAVQCRTADLLGRRAQQILVPAGKRDRHAAMDMRIDAARYDDLPTGVDDPPGTGRLQASRCADRDDLTAGDTDIRGLRAGRHHRRAAGYHQIEHRVLRYRVRLY